MKQAGFQMKGAQVPAAMNEKAFSMWPPYCDKIVAAQSWIRTTHGDLKEWAG